MGVTYNKPKGLKYTDMCIFIDKNFADTINPNEKPELEAKIFEYLYHIIYALALKSGYFKNFADYDPYALYAATEIYTAMHKKLVNNGKEIRGKIVVPVKSCLNYIKATIYPLKVNYQKDSFNLVLNPENYDLDRIEEKYKESIQVSYRWNNDEAYEAAIIDLPKHINEILDKSPFRNDLLMREKLTASILLTILNDITIPNALKDKLLSRYEQTNNIKQTAKIKLYYKNYKKDVIQWHLDEDLSNYIRFLANKANKEFSKSLKYYIHSTDLADELLDSIMQGVYDTSTDDSEG